VIVVRHSVAVMKHMVLHVIKLRNFRWSHPLVVVYSVHPNRVVGRLVWLAPPVKKQNMENQTTPLADVVSRLHCVHCAFLAFASLGTQHLKIPSLWCTLKFPIVAHALTCRVHGVILQRHKHRLQVFTL